MGKFGASHGFYNIFWYAHQLNEEQYKSDWLFISQVQFPSAFQCAWYACIFTFQQIWLHTTNLEADDFASSFGESPGTSIKVKAIIVYRANGLESGYMTRCNIKYWVKYHFHPWSFIKVRFLSQNFQNFSFIPKLCKTFFFSSFYLCQLIYALRGSIEC